MIVTIDGPAGAGKSSVARRLANRIGFRFLDTGAMYRAIAYASLERNVDPCDAAALDSLLAELNLTLEGSRIYIDDVDVTDHLRTPKVTEAVRYVADAINVRKYLSQLQRQAARGGSIVTEGRDQGTIVFPDAECKIYLSASPEVRAHRRWLELTARGCDIAEAEVLRQQTERDQHDRERPFGGLERADDAVEFCTDGLTLDEVIDRLESLVRQRQP